MHGHKSENESIAAVNDESVIDNTSQECKPFSGVFLSTKHYRDLIELYSTLETLYERQVQSSNLPTS